MSILTSPSNLRSSPPEWPDLARFTARDKVPCRKSAVCQRGGRVQRERLCASEEPCASEGLCASEGPYARRGAVCKERRRRKRECAGGYRRGSADKGVGVLAGAVV